MNHLVFMGSYPLELGAITPLFYTFREREMVQDLVEAVTGARMHHSYARVGGLKDDLPRGFLSRAREVLAAVRGVVAEYESLIMGNEIIFARCRDIGIISRETAIGYGCSGPVAQASGVAMDPRKDEPYEKYAEVEFEVPVGERGDSYDRLWVLVERVKQSCNIIEQCMDKLPPGPFRASGLPKSLKIPEGEIYVRNENPLGVMGYYVVGDGKKYPYRVKMRTASLLERGRDPRGAAGRADPRPDLDPRLDLLRRRRRRQVAVGYPCAPDGASHASRRFPRLVSGRRARRRPGGELPCPRHDGDQAVWIRHLGSDPRRARPAVQADRSREPVLPDAHPAVAPGEGEGARRGVRAGGGRGHARGRRGAR